MRTELVRAELVAVAEAQAGIFSRTQARAAGYTDDAIRHRLATRRWRRLRPGWYVTAERLAAVAAEPGGQAALATAALQRALSQPTWATGLTAAQVRGARLLKPPSRTTLAVDRDAGSGPRTGADFAVVPSVLPTHHRAVFRGVPLTSPARTIVDVARTQPFLDAVVVADSLLRLTTANRADLDRVLRDCWTWPGVAAARRVVSFADGRGESVLESVGRVVLHAHGLHPEPQVRVYDRHGLVARGDLLFVEGWTIVESDGLNKYADREVLREEKLRQERLERLGFVVVRATLADYLRNAAATARRVRDALAFAAARAAYRDPSVRLVSSPRFD